MAGADNTAIFDIKTEAEKSPKEQLKELEARWKEADEAKADWQDVLNEIEDEAEKLCKKHKLPNRWLY